MAKRLSMLIKNFLEAKLDGEKEGYDIACVKEGDYKEFYILFEPQTGLYKGQKHILHLNTEYDGGKSKFPFTAPKIVFVTVVYHTNISIELGGLICLDILKDKTKWVPTYNFSSIIRNILLLFEQPNNASPFNGIASRDYVTCEKEFMSRVVKGMTVKEEEDLKLECFAPFIKTANEITKQNEYMLKKYHSYFPQLTGKKYSAEYLEELNNLFIKFKLKNNEEKSDAPNKDITVDAPNKEANKDITVDAPVKQEHAEKPTQESTKESTQELPNQKDEKKVAPSRSRWAKYKNQ